MKRLLIATSCMLFLFAAKAFANKEKCSMQHTDSVTVSGVMPGYAQEAGKYTEVTFYLPHNLAQASIRNNRALPHKVYLDKDGRFVFTAPLDRRIAALMNVHPSGKHGYGCLLDVAPGDSVRLILEDNEARAYDATKSDKVISFTEFDDEIQRLTHSVTDSMTADTFAAKMHSLYKTHAHETNAQEGNAEAERMYNAVLSARAMAWCQWFDEERNVSAIDTEAQSAFRMVSAMLPNDKFMACNADFCTILSRHIANEILSRSRQSSSRQTVAAAMDSVCRLYEDTSSGHLSVLGQGVMLHILESFYGYTKAERDSIRAAKEPLFTSAMMREEWNKAFATMDMEPSDRVMCPSLLQEKKVMAIRRAHRSKYIHFVFVKNDKYISKRLLRLDNLRRDFRKSKDLTFVYCPVIESESDTLAFKEYMRQYPEEDFVMFSRDEYVKMLNALSSPFSTLDFTMDRNGRLLLDPLKPSDDEFNFRFLLRRMLENDKSYKKQHKTKVH